MALGDNLLGVAAIISSSTAAFIAWQTSHKVAKVDEKVDKVDTQTNSHLTELINKLDAMTTDRDEKIGERDEARRALGQHTEDEPHE